MRTSFRNCSKDDTKIGYVASTRQMSQIDLVKRYVRTKTNVPKKTLLNRFD